MTPVVVLDIDDTLYLERDYVRSGLRAVGAWAEREFGVPGIAAVAWRLFVSGLRGATISAAFTELGRPLSPAQTRAAVDVYRGHEPEIGFCPDVPEFLRAVGPVAVITDGPATSQRAKIRALGLARYTATIVVTDETPGWAKPARPAFQYVQRSFGAEPAACTYIGDNPAKDFAAPHQLGWSTVRVVRAGGLHADAEPTEPAQIGRTVRTLRDLLPTADPKAEDHAHAVE